MSEQYQVQIQGSDATIITERVVDQLVRLLMEETFSKEQFVNEIKNKVINDLKYEMTHNAAIQETIDEAIANAGVSIENRINAAINDKISEIEAINLSSFQISLK